MRHEADRERKYQKWAATHDAESLTNREMAARRALEWIGMSKALLVLDMKYQTCFLFGDSVITWQWGNSKDLEIKQKCKF